MSKFGFVFWEWKEQIDVEVLDGILKDINGPVRVTELDMCGIVVHTPDLVLTRQLWEEVWGYQREHDDIPDHAPTGANYLEASEQELKDWIRSCAEKEITDQQANEAELDQIVANIVDCCASGRGNVTGLSLFEADIKKIIDPLNTYQRQRVWEKLLDWMENSEGWTLEEIKELAAMLDVKQVSIKIA